MRTALNGILSLCAVTLLTTMASAQIDRLLVPVSAQAVQETTTRVAAPRKGTASHTLGADAFLAEAERELRAHLSLKGDLKLTLAQPWKALKLPAEDFTVAISEIPTGGITGTFLLRAKIMSGGDLVSDVQMSLRAQLWQDVWTATNRLDRGQALDRSLLTTSKVDVLREGQPQLLAEVDPTTLEIAQTVNASRPLTRRDVIERPLVRRGQVVEVVGRQGMLAISMKALAMENGAKGDLIKLRNLESRKEFSGQILNENKVQIHF